MTAAPEQHLRKELICECLLKCLSSLIFELLRNVYLYYVFLPNPTKLTLLPCISQYLHMDVGKHSLAVDSFRCNGQHKAYIFERNRPSLLLT